MGRSRRRRGCRSTVVVGLLFALAVPAGAAAEPRDAADRGGDEDPADEVDPAVDRARATERDAGERLRDAERGLRAAQEATQAARRAGRSADAGVRRVEETIVPTILDRREAEERRDEAEALVRSLRREIRTTTADLAVAREDLVDRVVRAYKQGSVAADTALPLVAVREARSPGEFATVLKDLETLSLVGASRVDELTSRLARLEAELVAAVAQRTEAREDLADAEVRVDDGERDAVGTRWAAEAAEARLLAAIERELAAEEEVARASAGLTRARAALAEVDDTADTDDATDPQGEDAEDDRADELRTRQRAHRRQASLAPEKRRTADDWACPVEDGRFVNDWFFPRKPDRRHEGTDVFASSGTPIVAVVDGTVVRLSRAERGLGGITVSYERGDHRFYNAHLQAIHPDLEAGAEVEAGDVIGWVGRTGNARGTPPHLHLGWYVDDVAANPYPSLAVACHDPDDDPDDDPDGGARP